MGTRRDKAQRSQALIEFALVSPVLLLLLFGVVDIGRAIFYYDTINHAAREGARVAVRAATQGRAGALLGRCEHRTSCPRTAMCWAPSTARCSARP